MEAGVIFLGHGVFVLPSKDLIMDSSEGRCSGSWLQQETMRERISAGSSSTTGEGPIMRRTVAAMVSAAKGLMLVAAKASTVARETMSLAGPAGGPGACSGGLSAGVPSTVAGS